MDGKHVQRSISVGSLSFSVPRTLEYFLLFGIGIVAFLLHSRLRTPLNMPGHHGLEFMAILMAGRVASRIPWASSISSLGIGLILLTPIVGIKDPLMGFTYMLPGFFLDAFFLMAKDQARRLVFIALIAGLAYAVIPLSRISFHFLTGYPYLSILKHGPIVPVLGYFIFGLAGGLTGGGISRSVIRKISQK